MQADPAKVYGLDVDNKGRAKLRSKPVDVSELLRQELFARCPSVSLVSATLTTSGTFDFVRRERKQAVRFSTEPPPPPPEPVRRPAHVAKMLAWRTTSPPPSSVASWPTGPPWRASRG